MFLLNTIKCRYLVILLAVILSGCSNALSDKEKKWQAIEQARPLYANNAIRLTMLADAQVNSFNNIPNSVTVLVAQAAKKEQLDQLLANPVLLRSFFANTGAAEGILQLDRYIMMPGQRVSLHIDRATQARYIAIIPGYYPAPSLTHSRISSLPVRLEKQSWYRTWFRPHYTAEFVNIQIEVLLGRFAIVRTDFSAEGTNKNVIFPDQTGSAASDKSVAADVIKNVKKKATEIMPNVDPAKVLTELTPEPPALPKIVGGK